MPGIKSTRMRYISAVSIDTLVEACTNLPFKVEIKGQPMFQKGRWYLFFIIPDNVVEFSSLELS